MPEVIRFKEAFLDKYAMDLSLFELPDRLHVEGQFSGGDLHLTTVPVWTDHPGFVLPVIIGEADLPADLRGVLADKLDGVFSKVGFVQSFSRVDGGFLLGVESASRHLAEVVNLTDQVGFSIEDVSVAKPDLGAVFFKHTGRQLQDGVQP